MDLLLGLGPLFLLLVFAVWVIGRGMRNDSHDRDTGGGHDGDAD